MLCYERYREGKETSIEEFKKVSGWDDVRIKNAGRHLFKTGLVYGPTSDQGDFKIVEVLPEGIRIVENEEIFESTFGIKLNLGVLSFSWDIRKKNNYKSILNI